MDFGSLLSPEYAAQRAVVHRPWRVRRPNWSSKHGVQAQKMNCKWWGGHWIFLPYLLAWSNRSLANRIRGNGLWWVACLSILKWTTLKFKHLKHKKVAVPEERAKWMCEKVCFKDIEGMRRAAGVVLTCKQRLIVDENVGLKGISRCSRRGREEKACQQHQIFSTDVDGAMKNCKHPEMILRSILGASSWNWILRSGRKCCGEEFF